MFAINCKDINTVSRCRRIYYTWSKTYLR